MTLLLLASCGRSRLIVQDGGPGMDGRPRDRSLLPDRPHGDTSPPPGCAALGGYTKGKRLTSFYARKARFSPSLKQLAMVTHRDNAPGDLYLFPLPSGTARLLATSIHDARWLPQDRGLLANKVQSGSSSTPYDLLHFAADGTKKRVLGSNVCAHVATPDGSRVYLVTECDKQYLGKLAVVKVSGGPVMLLATDVAAFSLVVSPDNKWAAYEADLSIAPGCLNPTGAVEVVNAAGKRNMLTAKIMKYSLQFTPANLLLARRVDNCKKNEVTFIISSPNSGTVSELSNESSLDFYGYGFFSGQRYAVTPDGKYVLFSRYNSTSLQQNDLLAMSTWDGTTRVLAKDLYPYQMTSMAFTVWTYANAGKHVVYVKGNVGFPQMGLAAVPEGGGKSLKLTDSLYGAAYVVSRDTADAAWIQASGPDSQEVFYGSVSSSARILVLASHKQPLSSLSMMPGGRGILLVQRSGAINKLVQGSSGGGSRVLGQWTMGYMTGSYPSDGPPVSGYQMDRLGCAVVYNRDMAGAAMGAYLQLLAGQ